uniref:Uncharacterized protein n=1 Tax=Corvus moneduloides TaxID=1196302 RepID=A0A8C3GV54_CORMO
MPFIEADPYFTVKLQDYSAVEKDDITLECELSKDVPVKWYKDGEELVASNRISIKTDGLRRILKIKKAAESDKGVYECDCGTDKTSANISVECKLSNLCDQPSPKNPGNPTIDLKTHDIVVVKGQKLSIPVPFRAVPSPTITWHKDGRELKAGDRTTMKSDYTSALLEVIDNCVRKDTGEYLLTVSNAAGSKTVALHLTVLDVPGPPTGPINILEVTPEYMLTVKAGTNVRLEANVYGKPMPAITWKKEGEILKPSEGVKITTKRNLATVELFSVNRKQTGDYTITAENASGSKSATIRLKVLGKIKTVY